VPVAYACNPSYSGGRGQEDHGSKPVQANSLGDPILKKPITKRAGGVAQDVGPEFKPQCLERKKKLKELLPLKTWSHIGLERDGREEGQYFLLDRL
jgi:hypothetical protein